MFFCDIVANAFTHTNEKLCFMLRILLYALNDSNKHSQDFRSDGGGGAGVGDQAPGPYRMAISGLRPLWSADNRTCLVKRSRNHSMTAVLPPPGQRCETVPEHTRQPDITFGQFKRSL